jgi:thiamine biosynthesis lipoprotein
MGRSKILRILLLASLLALLWLFAQLVKRGDYYSINGLAQGTTYSVSYASRNDLNLRASIDSLLIDFNASLSIYQSASVISRINQNDSTVLADDKFIFVFQKAYEVYQKTNGAFDITVAPLVNAMGFGNTDTLEVDSMMIDSLKQYVGMKGVRLLQGKVVKDHPRIMLDVNGLAQGYSVDLICQFLEEKGIKHYLVEVGGEVRAKGKNVHHQTWTVGIDKPYEGNLIPGSNLQAKIRLKNKAMATSGNYRKYYERNGMKFVHTIDPGTGYPVVSNLLSATVVTGDCILADAYATAFMVMGLKSSIHFLNQNPFLEACLIYTDDRGLFQMYVTPGLKKKISD